jgi:hypothetical protein
MKKNLQGAAAVVAAVLLNTITIRLYQDTFKEVTRKGEKVLKAVKHSVTFTHKTASAIESSKLSTWLIANLTKYQTMQKMQGRDSFDTSLAIELEILVNDQNVHSGIKFSLNPKTLERILERYPIVVGMVFNPKAFDYGVSAKQVLAFVNGYNTTIASATNAKELDEKINELPGAVVKEQLELETSNKEQVKLPAGKNVNGVIVPEALVS